MPGRLRAPARAGLVTDRPPDAPEPLPSAGGWKQRASYLGWVFGASVVILVVGGLASHVTGWIAVFAFLWLVLFVFGLIADEDANHWDWPDGKDGPATSVTLRIAAVTMLIAGVPCGLGWWFFSR